MKIGPCDIHERVFIIAEIGNNHEGDLGRAKEMVWAAARSGVDAVKFQTFRTEHYIFKNDVERFKRLKKFELGEKGFLALAEESAKAGVIFLSTPFDIDSADCLEPVVPAYKISSSDNNFFPLLEHVARKRKPILLSTGLADLNDIRLAKQVIENIWSGFQEPSPGLCLLHCVVSYPAEPAEINLNALATLRSEFGCAVGYSDHSLGIEASVLAVALGARIIEKHFTLDKMFSDFCDHRISADPLEMQVLVDSVRRAEVLLGYPQKVPQPSERRVAAQLRRHIAATRDMEKGCVVKVEDITWLRGSADFSAGREDDVVGKVLRHEIVAGDFFKKEHFKD